MKPRIPDVLAGLVLAGLAVGASHAEADAPHPPRLTGPNAVTFQYIHVPFLSSRTYIRKGTKDPLTGDCRMSGDMSATADELAGGHHKLSVQRAYDRDICEELVEEGIVRSDWDGSDDSEDPEGGIELEQIVIPPAQEEPDEK